MNRNGMGPDNQGPMTGWGYGGCRDIDDVSDGRSPNTDRSRAIHPGMGRGMGRGMRQGMGRGRGRGPGRNIGRGRGFRGGRG